MEDVTLMHETSPFSSFECHVSTTDRPGFPAPPHWHYFAEIVRVNGVNGQIILFL